MRPTFQILRGNRLVYLYGGGVINRDDATRDAHNRHTQSASLSSLFRLRTRRSGRHTRRAYLTSRADR
eukprot:scaffold123725_cov63-Phaeocystis_antarctica.AAC.3